MGLVKLEINVRHIPYKSREDVFYIVPIGDTHLGNCGFEKDRLVELVEWIKNKEKCFWIGMGDYVDCINYTDKRFDPDTIDDKYIGLLSNTVSSQTEDIIKLLLPIKDKCIGLHRGNHEEKIRLTYHYDVMHEMKKSFDAPILDDSAITILLFDRQSSNATNQIKIFSMHGCVGGRKGGNKVNWLEDLIAYVEADVYLIAHSHIKVAEIKTQLIVDRYYHLRQRKKVLGVTGSFLRGYVSGSSGYIEKMMLPPTDLGVIKVIIIPDKYDLHVSL